jgi:hypothetical protein
MRKSKPLIAETLAEPRADRLAALLLDSAAASIATIDMPLRLAGIRAATPPSRNRSPADHVFPIFPRELVVLGQRRKGVGHRFFGGFIPLQIHTLKDFAAAKPVRLFPDDL